MKAKREGKTGPNGRRQRQGLPLMRSDVAGMDIGSETHWVCAPTQDGSGREIGDFGATTPELIRMAEWLKARHVASVAMESTGVYWIAPHEVLEAHGLKVLLVDTRQLAQVPGRDKRQIRPIVSGFNDCTVADCCEARFAPVRRSVCCG